MLPAAMDVKIGDSRAAIGVFTRPFPQPTEIGAIRVGINNLIRHFCSTFWHFSQN
jgi:hypothetical protein